MSDAKQPPAFVIMIMKWFRKFGFARGLVRAHSLPRETTPAPLELYGMESCGKCRRVREALTELDLDYLHRSCPFGSERNRDELRRRGGKAQVPYLVDPNTGAEMFESRTIVAYLQSQYGSFVEDPHLLRASLTH